MSTTRNIRDETYNRDEALGDVGHNKPGTETGVRSNDGINKPIDWDLLKNPGRDAGAAVGGAHHGHGATGVGNDYSGGARRDDLDRTTDDRDTFGSTGRSGPGAMGTGNQLAGGARHENLDRTAGNEGTYGLTGRAGPGYDGGIGQPRSDGLLGREADNSNATDFERTGGDHGRLAGRHNEAGVAGGVNHPTNELGRHHRQEDVTGVGAVGGISHHTTEQDRHHRRDDPSRTGVMGGDRHPVAEHGRHDRLDNTAGTGVMGGDRHPATDHGRHHRMDDPAGTGVMGGDRHPLTEQDKHNRAEDTAAPGYGTGAAGYHNRGVVGEERHHITGAGHDTGYGRDNDHRHETAHGDHHTPADMGPGSSMRDDSHENAATRDRVGLGDKIKGTLEQIGGKVTKNPVMEERGTQRKTEGSTIDPAQRF